MGFKFARKTARIFDQATAKKIKKRTKSVLVNIKHLCSYIQNNTLRLADKCLMLISISQNIHCLTLKNIVIDKIIFILTINIQTKIL